jgi:hypothetical protein
MNLERSDVEHYVTLFDSLFLPQGLALHASLQRHAQPFALWVLCMDEQTKSFLDSLRFPTIRTIALRDIESPELLRVKGGRNRAEYCWTLTPFTPKIVFERDSTVQRVTYVDADVYLLKSPRPIFEEFEKSGKAVLITDHAYDPEYDQSAVSGQYCVQFMTFVREKCEPVRRWWEDRCIEWCFDHFEDGKLGDQKYLDDWPIRFGESVHVLTQLDALLAPWNARRFPYSRAIAWHFHGLRLLANNKVLLHGPYAVPEVVHQAVYGQYLQELGNSIKTLGKPVVQKAAHRPSIAWLKVMLRSVLKQMRQMRNYHVVRALPK